MKSKFTKRLVALVLCMAMVLSCSTYVLADETNAASEEGSSVVQEISADAEDVINEDESASEAVNDPEDVLTESTQDVVGDLDSTTKYDVCDSQTTDAGVEALETEDAEDSSSSDVAEPEMLQILEYEDGDVKVHVVEAAEGAIPADASLKVTPIVENDEEYSEVEAQLKEKAAEEAYEIAGFLAYDISFINADGKEVEPNGDVKVTMEYKEAMSLSDSDVVENAENVGITVMHFVEDENGDVAEIVDMVADESIEAQITTNDNSELEKAEFVTDSFSTFAIAETYASKKPGEEMGTTTATSGTADHIEIEISGTVTVKIGEEEFKDIAVTLTTADTYTVTAYTLGSDGTKTPYTNFTFSGTTTGDGSTADETIELSGSYPTGTKDNQVYYVVSVVKTVSVILADGTNMDIPVTLTVTTSYWNEGNNCPGIHNESGNETNWNNGYYIAGSGIDVPISGEYVGAAITKGKLAIKKTVTGEDSSTAEFQFYLQNSSGEYLTFTNNVYTGTSDVLTDTCKITVAAGQSLVLTDIPTGTYTITEIQKDGYIITDAEGEESDNYTKDYIVETKSDDAIPIANFTNKKLSDEAGIKIKKVGNGLSSYPNPTVAIYRASDCVDGVPNSEATAVWSGTLTTNSGEYIYLNVTLPAGDYVVVESGADVTGYELATTLTVDNTAAGMSFTAAVNTVHELVLTNTYKSTTTHSVEKIWEDNENSAGNRPSSVMVQLYANDAIHGDAVELNETNNWTYTFNNLPLCDSENNPITYTAREVAVAGYEVSYTYSDDGCTTTVTNTLVTQPLKLLKKAQGTNDVLSGAKFKLEKHVTNGDTTTLQLVGEYTSDADGAIFDGTLSYGTYKLTEIEAPAGYALLAAPYYIEISEDGISYWTEGNEDEKVILTVEGSVYELSIYNTMLYELPSTGGPGIFAGMLCGLACLMASAYALHRRRCRAIIHRR